MAAESPAQLMEKAIFQEETAGDLDAAMVTYRQIIAQPGASRALQAQAHLRLGACLAKKGQMDAAKAEYETVIAQFADQKDVAQTATERLGKATVARGPLVIRSSPLAFQDDVDPALAKIAVTFDQPMMAGSWSWTMMNAGTFPPQGGRSFIQRGADNLHNAGKAGTGARLLGGRQ
jgi:hypothetical protein